MIPQIALDNNNNFPIINHPAADRRFTRRQMVQGILGSLGTALAFPQILVGHPIHKHLAAAVALAQADARTASSEWTPEFLNSHQNELFTALAERIVPGSTQAQVNRIVDLLLTVEAAENQKAFVASLSALDSESHRRYNDPFNSLAMARQDELLTAVAAANKSQTLRDHFENLKGWIVGAYYSTEIGMRELGWTDDFYYEEMPGCQHTEEHR